jgi:hypothetical protein
MNSSANITRQFRTILFQIVGMVWMAVPYGCDCPHLQGEAGHPALTLHSQITVLWALRRGGYPREVRTSRPYLVYQGKKTRLLSIWWKCPPISLDKMPLLKMPFLKGHFE